MQNKNNVCVVIVTWNNEKDILNCLNSLTLQDYKDFKIIIVDNNSIDNTVSIINNNFKDVVILKQNTNLYLTPANNLGIKYSILNFNPEYILVLNPDTSLASNLISTLVNKIKKDKSVGAIGPKIKFWNNINDGLLNSAGLIYDGFMQAYDRGFKEEDSGQFDNDSKVFGVSGACILYKVKMLEEIGFYDESIKMYLDEVELFIRARKNNWKVLYTGETTLKHNYMGSTSTNVNFKRDKQIASAWLIIALKHYSFKSKIAMFLKYLNISIKF